MSKRDVVQFEGHKFLKQRLVFSILSQRPVRIDKIRSDDENPGLHDFEVSLLRLLEKATNGSRIVISHTGTSVLFRPGMIMGGRIDMDCPVTRAIGYYLEALVALAPFGKEQMTATLRGVTMNNTDLSVDTIRTATLVNYRNFGIEEGVELKITKRGAPPKGGGEVRFICPVVRSVKPINFTDEGKIRRIRGISYATRVSPQTANRMVEAARGELNRFIPDIYIYTDVYKGAESGFSPGFGISLVAESTTGVLMSAELCADPGDAPEDIGRNAAKMLLTEIHRGGCFDSSHQWLALLLMVLGPEHASKTRIGKLTPFSIQYLRDIRDFFNTTFKIKPDPESNTVVMTCLGSGYINVGKKTT
ncbi:18S rRNA biogenesis protein [Martensiomyces pterosporus]|nr:18S rRNA biogenesis protein [Martensiomyces pterosporus]